MWAWLFTYREGEGPTQWTTDSRQRPTREGVGAAKHRQRQPTRWLAGWLAGWLVTRTAVRSRAVAHCVCGDGLGTRPNYKIFGCSQGRQCERLRGVAMQRRRRVFRQSMSPTGLCVHFELTCVHDGTYYGLSRTHSPRTHPLTTDAPTQPTAHRLTNERTPSPACSTDVWAPRNRQRRRCMQHR